MNERMTASLWILDSEETLFYTDEVVADVADDGTHYIRALWVPRTFQADSAHRLEVTHLELRVVLPYREWAYTYEVISAELIPFTWGAEHTWPLEGVHYRVALKSRKRTK